VFSLAELGQMNGSVGGGGPSAGGGPGSSGAGGSGAGGAGSADDAEMPAMHEIGEELIWTGRCPP
jgi:sodium bicarbonate cotransporter 5